MILTFALVLTEIAAITCAKWILSIMIAIIAGVGLALTLITTAHSASLATSVLAELATVEARTITVQAAPADHLRSTVLTVLDGVSGVDAAVASGPASDMTNQSIPGGAAASSRRVWTKDWHQLGARPPRADQTASTALATDGTLNQLGIGSLPATVGNLSGYTVAVTGELDASHAAVRGLTGLIIPTPISTPGDVTRVTVVARSAQDVAPLTRILRDALPEQSSPTVRIRTSDTVSHLSNAIGVQLDAFGGALILSAIVGSGSLIAVVQCGLVLVQRRDFGRRRALGASRLMIIALISGHTFTTAAIGSALGGAVTVIGLQSAEFSLPPTGLSLAFAIILLTGTVGLSLVPAIVASRFDPASEMRSP